LKIKWNQSLKITFTVLIINTLNFDLFQ